MLTLPRRLARPFVGLALVAMLVPAQRLDCFAAGAGAHERMPCCSKGADAGTAFDAGCCKVREGSPVQEQVPTTVPAARRTAGDMVAPPTIVVSLAVPPPPGIARSSASNPDPPSDPLYLRLSIIRC